jgi:hypothetical protein
MEDNVTTQAVILEFGGVSGIELLELKEELPPGAVLTRSAEAIEVPDHGDASVGTAVIVLGVEAIQALALWLAKRRVKAESLAECTMERTADGGTIVHFTQYKKDSVSDAPAPDTVSAIAAGLSNILKTAGG